MVLIHSPHYLLWNDQYDYVCKKISQKIGVLKKIMPIVNDDILKTVYNSLVLPHMDGTCIVWGRCSNQNNINGVCKLQKRVAKIILQCKIEDISSVKLYQCMQWMPFNVRVSYKCCIMMYKVENSLVP